MKKTNRLTLITIAALCAIALHGAVPPAETAAERLAREQVQAFQEAGKATLAEPAPQIIQEYLHANQVLIKIHNQDRKNYYRVGFNDSENRTVRQSKWLRESLLSEKQKEEEIVLVPVIPVTINFYQKKGWRIAKSHLVGALSLSAQYVQNMTEIEISYSRCPYAIIHFRNGRMDRIQLSAPE